MESMDPEKTTISAEPTEVTAAPPIEQNEPDKLESALAAIFEDNVTVYEAEASFGISKSVICDWIAGKSKLSEPVFTDEEEMAVVEIVANGQLTSQQIIQSAQTKATELSKIQTPGYRWYATFVNRWPELNLTRPKIRVVVDDDGVEQVVEGDDDSALVPSNVIAQALMESGIIEEGASTSGQVGMDAATADAQTAEEQTEQIYIVSEATPALPTETDAAATTAQQPPIEEIPVVESEIQESAENQGTATVENIEMTPVEAQQYIQLPDGTFQLPEGAIEVHGDQAVLVTDQQHESHVNMEGINIEDSVPIHVGPGTDLSQFEDGTVIVGEDNVTYIIRHEQVPAETEQTAGVEMPIVEMPMESTPGIVEPNESTVIMTTVDKDHNVSMEGIATNQSATGPVTNILTATDSDGVTKFVIKMDDTGNAEDNQSFALQQLADAVLENYPTTVISSPSSSKIESSRIAPTIVTPARTLSMSTTVSGAGAAVVVGKPNILKRDAMPPARVVASARVATVTRPAYKPVARMNKKGSGEPYVPEPIPCEDPQPTPGTHIYDPFTMAQERALVQKIVSRWNRLNITDRDVLNMGKDLAVEMNFDPESLPTWKWVDSFIDRWPEMIIIERVPKDRRYVRPPPPQPRDRSTPIMTPGVLAQKGRGRGRPTSAGGPQTSKKIFTMEEEKLLTNIIKAMREEGRVTMSDILRAAAELAKEFNRPAPSRDWYYQFVARWPEIGMPICKKFGLCDNRRKSQGGKTVAATKTDPKTMETVFVNVSNKLQIEPNQELLADISSDGSRKRKLEDPDLFSPDTPDYDGPPMKRGVGRPKGFTTKRMSPRAPSPSAAKRRCAWRDEQLVAAVNALMEGGRMKEVSLRFCIPQSTLFDYAHERKKCLFTPSQETQIVKLVSDKYKTQDKRLTVQKVCELASTVGETKFKIGPLWYKNFAKRNEEVKNYVEEDALASEEEAEKRKTKEENNFESGAEEEEDDDEDMEVPADEDADSDDNGEMDEDFQYTPRRNARGAGKRSIKPNRAYGDDFISALSTPIGRKNSKSSDDTPVKKQHAVKEEKGEKSATDADRSGSPSFWKRTTWTPSNMLKAMAAVEKHKMLRSEVSKKYGIPTSTLGDYLEGRSSRQKLHDAVNSSKKSGKKRDAKPKEEKKWKDADLQKAEDAVKFDSVPLKEAANKYSVPLSVLYERVSGKQLFSVAEEREVCRSIKELKEQLKRKVSIDEVLMFAQEFWEKLGKEEFKFDVYWLKPFIRRTKMENLVDLASTSVDDMESETEENEADDDDNEEAGVDDLEDEGTADESPKKSKTKPVGYTAVDIEDALKLVKKGTSVKQAAAKYGIPHDVLDDYNTGKIKRVFEFKEEKQIVHGLEDLHSECVTLTKQDVFLVAYKVADKLGKDVTLNREWYDTLIQGWPKLADIIEDEEDENDEFTMTEEDDLPSTPVKKTVKKEEADGDDDADKKDASATSHVGKGKLVDSKGKKVEPKSSAKKQQKEENSGDKKEADKDETKDVSLEGRNEKEVKDGGGDKEVKDSEESVVGDGKEGEDENKVVKVEETEEGNSEENVANEKETDSTAADADAAAAAAAAGANEKQDESMEVEEEFSNDEFLKSLPEPPPPEEEEEEEEETTTTIPMYYELPVPEAPVVARASWTNVDVAQALKLVDAGMTMKNAAAQFHIPLATLHDRHSQRLRAGLTKAEEVTIVKSIERLYQELKRKVSLAEVLYLSKELAAKFGKKDQLNIQWFTVFAKKYPQLKPLVRKDRSKEKTAESVQTKAAGETDEMSLSPSVRNLSGADRLTVAIDAVRSGQMNLGEAARYYGVARTSLQDGVGKSTHTPTTSHAAIKTLYKKIDDVFNKTEEEIFVKALGGISGLDRKLRYAEVCDIAQTLALALRRELTPPEKWLAGLLARWPEMKDIVDTDVLNVGFVATDCIPIQMIADSIAEDIRNYHRMVEEAKLELAATTSTMMGEKATAKKPALLRTAATSALKKGFTQKEEYEFVIALQELDQNDQLVTLNTVMTAALGLARSLKRDKTFINQKWLLDFAKRWPSIQEMVFKSQDKLQAQKKGNEDETVPQQQQQETAEMVSIPTTSSAGEQVTIIDASGNEVPVITTEQTIVEQQPQILHQVLENQEIPTTIVTSEQQIINLQPGDDGQQLVQQSADGNFADFEGMQVVMTTSGDAAMTSADGGDVTTQTIYVSADSLSMLGQDVDISQAITEGQMLSDGQILLTGQDADGNPIILTTSAAALEGAGEVAVKME